MSNNNFNETLERVLVQIKSKWKILLPIAVVAVIVLVIIFNLIGAVFGGGYSVNKKAVKALQAQEPKKLLSCVPDDLVDEIMECYSLSKSEINDAIESANMLTIFNEVRKAKITKMKVIDKKKITPKVMEKNKDSEGIQRTKTILSEIDELWDTDDLKNFRMTTFSLSLKDEDSEKEKMTSSFLSVKYKGKWYSIDCMYFLVQAAEQYAQAKINREKYPALFD